MRVIYIQAAGPRCQDKDKIYWGVLLLHFEIGKIIFSSDEYYGWTISECSCKLVIHSSSINPKPSSFSAVGCGKRCLESAVDYRSMNHGTRQCQGTNTRESRQAPSRAFLRVVTQTEDVLIDRAGPRNAAWCRCGHYLCMQNAMMVPTRTA